MLDSILLFLETYNAQAGTAGFLLVVLGGVWAWIKKPFAKAPKTDLSDETIEKIASPKAKDGPALTTAEFIRIRRELKADLEAELAQAADVEKTQLTARIAELENQIANPEPALAEAKKRITDLETLLEREGNEIAPDRIAEARAALERGDFSLADDLFAEIEARAELEVQRAARAAYGRGEVAEQEIRWADAAIHYARAARLNPDFDALFKATHFTQLAGDYATAQRLAEVLVAEARRLDQSEKLSSALDRHATVLHRLGQFPASEPLFREALEIGRATIGEEHPDYAIHLNNLALVVQDQGRYAEAEELFRQALEIGRARIGEEHPDYAIRLNNLALAVKEQGRYAEAEELYAQALEIGRATIGEEHPSYAIRLNNLALAVQAQGRYGEAEELYAQSLEIGRATIGEEHPDYAIHLNNLAGLVQAQGRYAEAEELFVQCLKIRKAKLPPNHPYIKGVEHNLAICRAQKP